MSIRPSYGRRSVLQVLSDGMSQRPPTGKSCCEEAAMNAAEVDRLTRERDELHGYIAEYRDMWDRQLRRAECAEAELDRMCKVLAVAKAERDELQAKLDAAENRPEGAGSSRLANASGDSLTLDREAVKKIVIRESHGSMTDRMDDALTDAIMALALAEEAQRSAEEEARIEEQAKELWEAVSQYGVWVNVAESARERYRAAIRAGWTKEDQ